MYERVAASPFLLCNPPSLSHQVADRQAFAGMGTWREAVDHVQPPYTLAACAAMLRNEGWNVAALDAVAEQIGLVDCLHAVAALHPAAVLLLVSPTTSDVDLRFAEALRLAYPTIPLLLLGLATRYIPPVLVRQAHMTLVGEPESAIVRACRYLLSRKRCVGAVEARKMTPIAYSSDNRLHTLNQLPRPAWDLFPVHRYKCLPVVVSRGCGMGCRYCPVPVTSGKLRRVRPVESVAAEMAFLIRRYGTTHFYLLDPLFAEQRYYAEQLCDALVRWGIPQRATWSCETRPEQLDEELLRRMEQAGCRELHLGLETVSPQVLTSVKRLASIRDVPLYVEGARQLLELCNVLRIRCHLHILAGLPGDPGGANVTRTFLQAYSTESVQVNELQPFPGTSIFPTNDIQEEKALLSAAVPHDRGHWWDRFDQPGRLRSA